jgi:hypothetical protein
VTYWEYLQYQADEPAAAQPASLETALAEALEKILALGLDCPEERNARAVLARWKQEHL